MVATKTTHVKTLIIGGGLTGLATAWALQKRGCHDYLVLEAKSVPGGLCATTSLNGYSFDYGGHFLHLHTKQGKQLVTELLGKNLTLHDRHAFVYTYGMKIPAPIQYNLWAMNPQWREAAAFELKQKPHALPTGKNFETWCLRNFGFFLYEAFFRPYNEKLWGRPLNTLTTDWCAPFIPRPNRKTMLSSIYKKPNTEHGYNTQFYYPKKGGCGAIINALVRRVKHLRLNAPVTRLDVARKTAWIGDEAITYENLVSTIPLPALVEITDKHAAWKRAADKLDVQGVTVYHLAIARKIKPFSWIYCPDDRIPFYRVGLTSAVIPHSVPRRDTSLFSIELPGIVSITPETEEKIWNALYTKDLVGKDDVKVFSACQTIPCAYVVFNKERARTVSFLLAELKKHHCYCAGRYGRWEYSFMESSLLQAEELAKKLA